MEVGGSKRKEEGGEFRLVKAGGKQIEEVDDGRWLEVRGSSGKPL